MHAQLKEHRPLSEQSVNSTGGAALPVSALCTACLSFLAASLQEVDDKRLHTRVHVRVVNLQGVQEGCVVSANLAMQMPCACIACYA